ncbi:MAG TPA: polysaccharide deacetylase family protein [Burkholderiales bacterium]|nr:polysaccharide deacetylase family protein [Burkholderiales bacterium]
MSTLILIYHAVSDAGGGAVNPHHLPWRNFEAQVRYVSEHQFNVLSWRELTDNDRRNAEMRLVFTFDDGARSDLDSARLLAQHGFDALFFVSTSLLGTPGYLTPQEILELSRAGMGIGSHAHRHEVMTPRTESESRVEFARSKGILEDIVQSPVFHFSFPGGAYNRRLLNIGRSCGYRYFFTSDWGVNGERQRAAGVFRRTSVLNTFDARDIEALVRRRNYFRRQLAFRAKELGKKVLSDEGYSRLRRAFLDVRRTR